MARTNSHLERPVSAVVPWRQPADDRWRQAAGARPARLAFRSFPKANLPSSFGLPSSVAAFQMQSSKLDDNPILDTPPMRAVS